MAVELLQLKMGVLESLDKHAMDVSRNTGVRGDLAKTRANKMI